MKQIRSVAAIAALLLFGCVTVPEGPSWLTSFPRAPGYFVGIGASATGDLVVDMERARAAALSDLAASISTRIRSEQRFTTRDDGEGNSRTTAEVTIYESVSANLTEVEVFDSYYSADVGYWFYLRLDQGKWEAIQNREVIAMVDRIESIVTNAYVDPSATQSSRLAALAKAWSLLSVSPYAGFVDSVLLGESGSLLDIIESEIKRIVDSLSITFNVPVVVEEGRPIEIGLTIASSDSVPSGRHVVTLDDSDNHRLGTVVTDRNGAYQGSIDARYDPGKVIIALRVDLDELGIDVERIPLAIQEPLETVQLDVRQIRAGLRVRVDEGINIGDAESGISALMSDIAPFKLGNPSETDRFLVSVEIQSRTAPTTELTEGITICFLTLSVTISSGGDDLYSFRSNEKKGAGLDLEQAQARAFDELIDDTDEFSELRIVFEQIVDLE